jgi:prepilin-type processing-associated H-X9-DG protein
MAILPYIEQDSMWRAFVNFNGNDLTGIRYGTGVNSANVTSQKLKVMLCPSDADAAPFLAGGVGLTHHNYGVNYGNTNMYGTTVSGVVFGGAPFRGYPAGWLTDATMQATYGWAQPDSDKRALFGQHGKAGQPQGVIHQMVDGSSNTLMMAELVKGQGGNDLRGFIWWGSASGFTAFNLPNSNAPDVMTGGACNVPATWNIPCTTLNSQSFPKMSSARSRHTGGGVNVVYCDGHVAWAPNTINLAVWRALSTSQGGEVVNE